MRNYNSCTTTWAEETYRPLLKEIALEGLDLTRLPFPFAVPRLDAKYLCGSLAHCQLFIKVYDNDERLGYCSFHFEKGTCRIAICLSKKLLGPTGRVSIKTRNIVGTHEFLHCISALLCIQNLTTRDVRDKFLADCGAKMSLDILSAERLSRIAKANGGQVMGRSSPNDPNSIFFSDDHYRLSMDKSSLKYHNLYDRFLLSKQEFESYFTEEQLAHIKHKVKTGGIVSAYEDALTKKDAMAKDLDLDEGFVVRRTAEMMNFYFQGQD